MNMRAARRRTIELMRRKPGWRWYAGLPTFPINRPNIAMNDRWAKKHVPRLLGPLARKRCRRPLTPL